MNEKAGDEHGLATWLICRAGTHLCAMPLQQVIEVMRMLPIEQLSGAPHYVRGLCIIRGSPVPVIDTAALIGEQATRAERLVVIRTGNRTAALAVVAVIGIRAIAANASGPLPPLLKDAATEIVAAIGILDAELLFFLQATRMVSQDLLSRLDALETVT